MRRKLPVTKDKRRQKRILAAAQLQCDKLGLRTDLAFNEEGELLVDGKTSAQIDAEYDEVMKRFYEENIADLEHDLLMVKDHLDEINKPVVEKTNIIPLVTAIGPEIHNPHPLVLRFENKK